MSILDMHPVCGAKAIGTSMSENKYYAYNTENFHNDNLKYDGQQIDYTILNDYFW